LAEESGVGVARGCSAFVGLPSLLLETTSPFVGLAATAVGLARAPFVGFVI
jgi:hypothetical protein